MPKNRDYLDLLAQIENYIAETGGAPTTNDVMVMLETTSPSHAAYALNRLEGDGHIVRPRVNGHVVNRLMKVVRKSYE